MSRNGPSAWGNANRNGPPAFGNPPSFPTYIASLLEMADSRPDSATTSPAIRGEEMNIEELIADLRARINPQYYDQIGTESYERNQCVMALESLLARIEVLRKENAALSADAARIDWLADVNNTVGSVVLPREIVEANISSLRQAIDAARGEK